MQCTTVKIPLLQGYLNVNTSLRFWTEKPKKDLTLLATFIVLSFAVGSCCRWPKASSCIKASRANDIEHTVQRYSVHCFRANSSRELRSTEQCRRQGRRNYRQNDSGRYIFSSRHRLRRGLVRLARYFVYNLLTTKATLATRSDPSDITLAEYIFPGKQRHSLVSDTPLTYCLCGGLDKLF